MVVKGAQIRERLILTDLRLPLRSRISLHQGWETMEGKAREQQQYKEISNCNCCAYRRSSGSASRKKHSSNSSHDRLFIKRKTFFGFEMRVTAEGTSE